MQKLEKKSVRRDAKLSGKEVMKDTSRNSRPLSSDLDTSINSSPFQEEENNFNYSYSENYFNLKPVIKKPLIGSSFENQSKISLQIQAKDLNEKKLVSNNMKGRILVSKDVNQNISQKKSRSDLMSLKSKSFNVNFPNLISGLIFCLLLLIDSLPVSDGIRSSNQWSQSSVFDVPQVQVTPFNRRSSIIPVQRGKVSSPFHFLPSSSPSQLSPTHISPSSLVSSSSPSFASSSSPSFASFSSPSFASSSPFHFTSLSVESSNHSFSYLPPLESLQLKSRPPSLSPSTSSSSSSSESFSSASSPTLSSPLLMKPSPSTLDGQIIVVSSRRKTSDERRKTAAEERWKKTGEEKRKIQTSEERKKFRNNYHPQNANYHPSNRDYNHWNNNRNNVIFTPNKKRSPNRKTTKDVQSRGGSGVKNQSDGGKRPFYPPLPPPRPASRKPGPESKSSPESDPPRSNPLPSESSPEATTVIKPEPLSRQCLSCICNANTNCDESIKCVLNEFCGPFLISNKYWIEAGKLGSDYRSCVFNRTCAEETVTNYMAKYASDCNGDHFIDCDDYVALHQLGPAGCKALASAPSVGSSSPVPKSSNSFYQSNYWNFYQYCYHMSPLARREYPAIESPDEIDPRLFVADTPNGIGTGSSSGSRRSKEPGLVVPKFTVRPITPDPRQKKESNPSFYTSTTESQLNGKKESNPSFYTSTTESQLNGKKESNPSFYTSTTESPLNDVFHVASECLDCLCEANGCNKNITCSDSMSLDYMNTGCGPFLISYKYWLDSGREPDRVAFHSCASDKSCSRAIVTSYLNKYSTDCNSDGFVDCVDYVLVHKLGYKYCRSLAATNMALSLSPSSSSSSSSSYTSGLSVRDDPIYDTKYWKKFQKCYGFGRK